MLSVKEAAERIGVSPSSVRVWLAKDKDRFPGAQLVEPPIGVSYWLIPESAVEGFEMGKSGRPLKPESELKYPRRASRRKDSSK